MTINKQTFDEDFEYYKDLLSENLSEDTVNLMLHSYCMGFVDLAQQLMEQFDVDIYIQPALEKIKELDPLIQKHFK